MIYPKTSQTAGLVADHYDSLDEIYRTLWGEHMHHGLWETGKESIHEATLNLLELIAASANITPKSLVCDIGCGYGGTARYFAAQFNSQVTGLTISSKQWNYAKKAEQINDNPKILLCDFLNNSLPSNYFDTVLSIESSEHMEDKERFFSEVYRILKPGGKFVTAAWLSCENPKPWEISYLLEPICREGRLPGMGSKSDYSQMMEAQSLKILDFKDLTKKVRKTWVICLQNGVKAFFTFPAFRKYMLNVNSSERHFVKTILRMWIAYYIKSLRYGLFVAVKG